MTTQHTAEAALTIDEQNVLAQYALEKRRSSLSTDGDGNKGFENLLIASRTENRIAQSYTAGEVAVLRRSDFRWCIVHPSTKSPGKYQITFCNESGFLSDSTVDTVYLAIKQCLIEGYRVRLAGEEADQLMAQAVAGEAETQERRRQYEGSYAV